MRTFPTGPAAAALRRYARARQLTRPQLAAHLGLPDALIRHCFDRDRLGERNADRLACAMGCHPFELWPAWFAEVDAETGLPVSDRTG